MLDMGVGPLLALGVILSLLAQVESGVFVVAPNVLNANELETVSVLVTSRTVQTQVTLTIQSNNQVHSTITESFPPEEQKIVKVRVDGTKLGAPDSHGRHYVQLSVQCGRCGNFDKTTEILVNKRTGTVFLQTDKPLYSPGQTVIIRVFALDEARMMANIPIKMEIKNPQGILIVRKNESTEAGLFLDEFHIPSQPLQGFWKISVHFGTNDSETRERKIEIKKYVLPHFQVSITNPRDFIDSLNKDFVGAFEARYSFNAAVVGQARVVFRVVTGGEATYLTHKSYLLRNGKADFEVNPADMTTLEMQNLLDSESHLQVEVIVTENSTGISEKAVARCPFVVSPYVISFDGTPKHFMPGLTFEVKITASYVTGTPLTQKDLNIIVTDQLNRPVGRPGGSRIRTNSNGVASYNIDRWKDIESIKIKVNVQGDLKTEEYVLHKAKMPGYMKISASRTLQPGVPGEFEARLTDVRSNIDRFQFMMVSGGRITYVDHKERGSIFRSDIGYNNVPSIRMVAWYFRTDTQELVATSTKLQVKRKCKTEAEVKLECTSSQGPSDPNAAREPGETCDLIFKGPSGAKVAPMVVDKSVYYMSNDSRLTRDAFFDEFESRDLGCAVGGGANATDVFMLAGLTILTDTFTHPRRESLNCTQNTNPASRHKRSTREQDPDEETCCNRGKQFANSLVNIGTSQLQHIGCFRGAANYTSRSCKNSFGRCCVERAAARACENQDHSRTDPTERSGPVILNLEDESAVTERTDFRDSWHHSSTTITNSGEIRKFVTLPDSITTWVFQAVTMSATEGMCVARPFEQVVRKETFLKLHLPHTAVLGEQMELAATVYNMGPRKVYGVKVRLLIGHGLCSSVAVGNYSQQDRDVEGWQSWTARWPIVPTNHGITQITVQLLIGDNLVDRIKQNLNVVPSGDLVVTPMLQITQDPRGRKAIRESWNGTVGSLNYSVSRDTRRREQTTTIPLKLPRDAHFNTAIMKFSLLGDVMTPIVKGFLDGTEKHLHKPKGCGEQTMARVGPLVFTAHYLSQQGKLGEVETATREKVKDGVERMLTFREESGGFKVWQHLEPRLWLTAFTLKTFTQARKFTDFDPKVIDEAQNWLMMERDASGMFANTGIRYDEDMAGGAVRRVPLTAYVYISLKESGYAQQQDNINRAMTDLAAAARTEDSAYTLAIVTYALAIHRHPDAEAINQRLLTKSRNLTAQQPVQTYWPTNPQHLNQIGSELEVETAAYSLLAQLALRHVEQSNSIVEWLLRQRYAGHLYKTTQSTVLSLQALAEYSAVAVKDDLDMTCTLSFPRSERHVFNTINNDNRLLQQTHEVTEQIGDMLTIECEGTGVTHTTVETSYYSSKSQGDNCAFNITAQAILRNNIAEGARTIKVCTRLKDARQKFDMPMVEVGIGTGFSPDTSSLDSLLKKKEVDFYEVNNRSVVLYMNQIPSNKDLCLTFDITRTGKVNNIQPVPVKVYAYYEPDRISCRTFYHPLGEEAMLDVKCNNGEASCRCLENICPICYGYTDISGGATLPLNTRVLLKERACLPKYNIDYVHVGVVRYSNRTDGELRHTIRIDSVTKPGTEYRNALRNVERVYVVGTKCPPCKMERDRRYLIMGQDGPSQKEGVHEYYLTPRSYVVPLYSQHEKSMFKNKAERRINRIHKKFIQEFDNCGV